VLVDRRPLQGILLLGPATGEGSRRVPRCPRLVRLRPLLVMNPGLAGFRANKNPDLSHSGIWKMTKRDKQASEYAAESYEKPPAERGVSNTFDLITDANDFLLDMATRRVARTHYEGCRKEHVECLVAALVREIAQLREAIRRLAEQDATLSVCGGNVTVTMDATPALHATPGEGSVQGGCSVLDSRNWKEPVAWAVVYPNDEVAIVAFKRRDADERASASDRVVPLYRSPTLTDEEREAVETAVRWLEPYPQVAATLRNLLERTK
jgi:hypothetical protein